MAQRKPKGWSEDNKPPESPQGESTSGKPEKLSLEHGTESLVKKQPESVVIKTSVTRTKVKREDY